MVSHLVILLGLPLQRVSFLLLLFCRTLFLIMLGLGLLLFLSARLYFILTLLCLLFAMRVVPIQVSLDFNIVQGRKVNRILE